jgi:hypothetical protein
MAPCSLPYDSGALHAHCYCCRACSAQQARAGGAGGLLVLCCVQPMALMGAGCCVGVCMCVFLCCWFNCCHHAATAPLPFCVHISEHAH